MKSRNSDKPWIPTTSVSSNLLAAAAQHKVTINESQITYVSNGQSAIAHAPLAGIERYGEKEFAKGAAIQLLMIDGKQSLHIPSGSYVVKAQFEQHATDGTALFTDSAGVVVAHQPLLIRSRAQAAVIFPDVYTEPAGIPVITSTHVWIVDKDGKGHWGVDCSGWQPYRTLYYYVD